MDSLKDTLTLVNDWLKFAETKNAVMITATGVSIWSAVRLAVSDDVSGYMLAYLAAMVIFFAAAFISSLLSFLPVLDYLFIVPRQEPTSNTNILHFGYLSTISKSNLIEKYIQATDINPVEVKEIHHMYAEQIIINSKVAMSKYAIFDRSVKLVLTGIMTPFIALPFLFFRKSRRE